MLTIVKTNKIPKIENNVKGLNLDSSNEYFILKKDNEIICFASYKKIKNCYHIKSNYTFEKYRKKGYMTKLLNFIVNVKLKGENIKVYCLQSSYKIYLKLGFELLEVKNHKYFDTYIVERRANEINS